MNDIWFIPRVDEGDSSLNNLQCSRTRSPVRTKRKRTNADIEELDKPEKKGTVDETFGVRVDLKPRWRRVIAPDSNQDRGDIATARMLFRAEGSGHPAEVFLKNSLSIIDEASESQFRHTPKTPTFRPTATHPQKEELHGNSPDCVVSGQDNYDNLYLCHRSLAWSDDEWSDDEYIDNEAKNLTFAKVNGDVHTHHNVLANSTFEATRSAYAFPPQPLEKQNLHGQPLAVSGYRYRDSPQNTSEIFWEEKVLDVLDLERMARLSI